MGEAWTQAWTSWPVPRGAPPWTDVERHNGLAMCWKFKVHKILDMHTTKKMDYVYRIYICTYFHAVLISYDVDLKHGNLVEKVMPGIISNKSYL